MVYRPATDIFIPVPFGQVAGTANNLSQTGGEGVDWNPVASLSPVGKNLNYPW